MASGSCLTIKHGLIWNVKNRVPFRNSESPEFIFMNSIWKVVIDLTSDRDRSTADIIVNITLRNLCEFQSPQPFEVITFLEDKQKDAHMRCAKVTVSSRDAVLYKVSFYALCKKLPAFNMINDLTVLFLFSASIDLGLNMKRDYSSTEQGNNDDTPKSSLNIVPCLVWESTIPRMQGQISPVFSLLGSRWKLELILTNSQTIFHPAYQISLKYCGGSHPYPEIVVKAFLDHKEYNVQYRLSSRPDGVSATMDTFHKARFDSIHPEPEGFENCNDIIVVIIFNPSNDLALIEETGENGLILTGNRNLMKQL